MKYTIEETQQAQLVDSSMAAEGRVISRGTLASSTHSVDYTIHLGLDFGMASRCDDKWGAFTESLLSHIKSLEVSGVDIAPILQSAQLEDSHWSWRKKTIFKQGESYKWFFLIADKVPQAVCLIYHPQPSVMDAGDIFYVEYLAVAPWNRENLLAERVFKGVGSKLLFRIISYAKDDLNLKAGFSLHSLPQAEKFYQKIGMKSFAECDKDGTRFFEWAAP
ncbi:GNAT family N-acetyltransferase [Burkholderiaceae bacterium]|nr:GNAT family N-acetyltransferase [Burkholderiaceae bacterium]